MVDVRSQVVLSFEVARGLLVRVEGKPGRMLGALVVGDHSLSVVVVLVWFEKRHNDMTNTLTVVILHIHKHVDVLPYQYVSGELTVLAALIVLQLLSYTDNISSNELADPETARCAV